MTSRLPGCCTTRLAGNSSRIAIEELLISTPKVSKRLRSEIAGVSAMTCTWPM
jgi:hypothetical protein